MIGRLLLRQIDSSLEDNLRNLRRGARLTAALAFSVVLGCIGFPTPFQCDRDGAGDPGQRALRSGG